VYTRSSRPARSRSTLPRRIVAGVGVFTVTTLAVGTAGVAHLAATLNTVERADTGTALTKKDEPQAVENYLLVGSDTRQGSDPNSQDYGAIGNEGAAPGRRSDTIMVLRFDPKSGNAAILSIPRDLWVPIAGTNKSDRINSAYTKGNDVLINTVEQNFGIPINHFIDVDFYGFKDLVDALGGVTVYFDLPTRDKNTGLRVTQPGCVTLNGIDALAYVRSRHFAQEINGKWREDQSSDFGRISRQQDFIRRAATKAFASAKSNPLGVSSLVKAALKSVHPDASLNLTALADRLAALGTSEIATFTLPAYPDHVGDAAILRLDQEKATALLSFFGGKPPADAATTTAAPPTTNAAGSALPPAPGGAPSTTNPLAAFAPPPTSAPIGTVPDQSATCG
jgi:polyisoprenyl-teichoic acid--peptidoglycan teichoic acid transferase